MDADNKTVREHLKEMLHRFLLIIIPFSLLFIFFFFTSPYIYSWLILFLELNPNNIVALSPFDNMIVRFQIAFAISLVSLIPLICVSMYNFCKEIFPSWLQRKIEFYILCIIILSFIGVGVGVFGFSKAVLAVLGKENLAGAMWGIKSVVSFILFSSLAFAILMQIILIIPLLNKYGLLPKIPFRKRILIIPFIMIISALLTPPDVVSQLFMAGITYGGVELGFLFCIFNKNIGGVEVC